MEFSYRDWSTRYSAWESFRSSSRLYLKASFVHAAHDESLKRLAGAIIGQAARDALKVEETGREARGWLLSSDCGDL